ncbi:MAG: hypothetical protein ACQUHE_18680, partial [Bacteroidia bacterium]
MRWRILIFLISGFFTVKSQPKFETRFSALRQVTLEGDVTLTFDEPENLDLKKPTKLIIFSLPNGNTTAQSFGKNLNLGDDWHFDIQHIGAQTTFIRHADPSTNYVVVYLENSLKSWPAWRRKYSDADKKIGEFVHHILDTYGKYKPKLILTGHSGGGSFIFGFVNAFRKIPSSAERIGFLDATYGYETDKHLDKLKTWLDKKGTALQVIAYNDSVVIYNGKPLVSPTGGTWYRSKLMANDLAAEIKLRKVELHDR